MKRGRWGESQRDGGSEEEGTEAEWTGKYEKFKSRVARSCQGGYCTGVLEKTGGHGKKEARAKDEPCSSHSQIG